MSHKVAVLAGPATDHLLHRFSEDGDTNIAAVKFSTKFDFCHGVADAEVAVLAAGAYDETVRQALELSSVRFVQGLTAGFEQFETVGVPSGIAVSNAGAAWAPSVAEHAMALLLSVTRRIPDAVANQAKRGWDRSWSDGINGLRGQTLGIIGFGNIGQKVAALARPFGVRILGVSRSGATNEAADEMFPMAALDDVLTRSHSVVITIPHTTETHHLFDAHRLAVMRPGAILVNVSRGGLVDHASLRSALESGALAGAGIDVSDPEPLPSDDPTWGAPNLLITPHVAGSSGDVGWNRIADEVSENIRRFLRGDAIRNVVLRSQIAS